MLWKFLNLEIIILCCHAGFDSIIHHRDFPCQLFVFWTAVCWLVVPALATPKQWENIIRYCHIVNVSSFHSTAENFFNQSNLFFCLPKTQPAGTIVNSFSPLFLKPEVWEFTSTSSPIWVEISCAKRVTSQGNLQKGTVSSSIASCMQRYPKKIPLMRRKRSKVVVVSRFVFY